MLKREFRENKIAYLISKNERVFLVEIKDLLQRRGWKILDEAKNLEQEAFLSADSGKISMFIIDDSSEFPAFDFIRTALFREVGIVTPCLILSSDHASENLHLTMSMSDLVVVKKPFSPDDFLKGFDELVRKWSSGCLLELRSIGRQIASGNNKIAVERLVELYRKNDVTPLVNAALALQYRKQNKLQIAEKVLLQAIENGILEMSIVLPLLEVFIYNAKPELAEDLLLRVYEKFNRPAFLCVPMIQVLSMQNKISETIPFLHKMIESSYFAEVAKMYLPRVLYSCGLIDDFHESIKQKSNIFDEFQKQWHVLSASDAAKRKKQFEAVVKKRKADMKALAETVKIKPEKNEIKAPIGKPLFF